MVSFWLSILFIEIIIILFVYASIEIIRILLLYTSIYVFVIIIESDDDNQVTENGEVIGDGKAAEMMTSTMDSIK